MSRVVLFSVFVLLLGSCGGGGGGNNYGTPVEPPDDFNGTPGEDDAEDT